MSGGQTFELDADFEQYGDGRSEIGVTRYMMEWDAIHVQFHDERVYVYDANKPGVGAVQEMQRLARAGKGLSTYISQHVGNRYARWYVIRRGQAA
jgi:hypothetical protein